MASPLPHTPLSLLLLGHMFCSSSVRTTHTTTWENDQGMAQEPLAYPGIIDAGRRQERNDGGPLVRLGDNCM